MAVRAATTNEERIRAAVGARQKELGKLKGDKNYIISGNEIAQAYEETFGKIPVPNDAEILEKTPIRVVYRMPNGQVIEKIMGTNLQIPDKIGTIQENVISQPDPATAQAAQERERLEQAALEDILSGRSPATPPGEGGEPGAQPTIPANPEIEQLRQLVQQLPQGGMTEAERAELQRLQDVVRFSQERLQGLQGQQPGLAQLDPQTQSALEAINQAQRARLQQQFQEGQANLVAQLYGRGVQQSSLANDAAARALQEQGLVGTQQAAEEASRQLAIQQFLAQLGLESERARTAAQGQFGQLGLEGLNQAINARLSGTGAAADILGRSGQLSQAEQARLAEIQNQEANRRAQLLEQLLAQGQQESQFGRQLGFARQQQGSQEDQARAAQTYNENRLLFDIEQARRANSIFGKILGTVGTIAGGPIGGLIGKGIGGLFGGGGQQQGQSQAPTTTAAASLPTFTPVPPPSLRYGGGLRF